MYVCVCVYVTLWCQFKRVGDRVKESVKKAMEYFDPEFYDYEVMLLVIICVKKCVKLNYKLWVRNKDNL